MVADETEKHLEKLLKDKASAEMLIKKIEEMTVK